MSNAEANEEFFEQEKADLAWRILEAINSVQWRPEIEKSFVNGFIAGKELCTNAIKRVLSQEKIQPKQAPWRKDSELPIAIPIVIHCPRCGEQHIDRPETDEEYSKRVKAQHGMAPPLFQWDNPPHKTHQCQGCFHEFRPANIHTVGVEKL
jgi:hypothetical protein